MARLEYVMGTEIVDDIRLGHTWYEYGVLDAFLHTRYLLTSFIEIGVHEGGLSYLLLPKLSYIYYMGVEINCDLVRPEVKKLYEDRFTADLICSDCFDSELRSKIIYLPRKLIYCDGGNKVAELHYFKDICRDGDILMAHDYWDGKRQVHNVPTPHPEVTPEDIVDIDADKSFIRLPEEIFQNTRIVGWEKIG